MFSQASVCSRGAGGGRYILPPGTDILVATESHMVCKRAVRILLECFIVIIVNYTLSDCNWRLYWVSFMTIEIQVTAFSRC